MTAKGRLHRIFGEPSWPKRGRNVTETLPKRGSNVASTWLKRGFNVAPTWLKRGLDRIFGEPS